MTETVFPLSYTDANGTDALRCRTATYSRVRNQGVRNQGEGRVCGFWLYADTTQLTMIPFPG